MIRLPLLLAPVPLALTRLPASTATLSVAARMISGANNSEPVPFLTTMSVAVTSSCVPNRSPLRVPPTSRLPAPKFERLVASIVR
ncbi:hypothetical protein D9M68_839000 [compost metagenome]